MKCPACRNAELHETTKVHRYAESGLPNVVLQGVKVKECPKCGHRLIGIPKMEQLHRTLAIALIRKPTQLAPEEVVFLRKSLGWSQTDLARRLHFDPATVNRWERGKEPIGDKADVTLRLAVALSQRIDDYSVDELDKVAASAAESLEIALSPSGAGWRASA